VPGWIRIGNHWKLPARTIRRWLMVIVKRLPLQIQDQLVLQVLVWLQAWMRIAVPVQREVLLRPVTPAPERLWPVARGPQRAPVQPARQPRSPPSLRPRRLRMPLPESATPWRAARGPELPATAPNP
jgi:hypothetical protein